MSRVVLVTGATGFVGRQVVRALGQQGVSIRCVTRRPEEVARLEGAVVERVVVTRDVFAESMTWWAEACGGVDTVIHLAWYVEPGQYLDSPKSLDCLVGTVGMARGAADAGVRRFVGMGTCFEYDTSVGTLSVDTPLRPTSTYSGAKAATYMALSTFLPAAGVEFLWCRLFYLYGDHEDDRRLVPYLRASLKAGVPANLTSGNQVRDFLDVRQAGEMIVSESLGGRCGAVNICSAVPITVRQFAERIADEYGRRDLLRFGARPDNAVDPAHVVGVR